MCSSDLVGQGKALQRCGCRERVVEVIAKRLGERSQVVGASVCGHAAWDARPTLGSDSQSFLTRVRKNGVRLRGMCAATRPGCTQCEKGTRIALWGA